MAGEGFGLTFLLPTAFLWGGALIATMLIMLYKVVSQDADASSEELPAAPDDD